MSRNGEDGADGLSAYLIARQQGFSGSVLQWLDSLKGAPGVPGTNGKDGVNGTDGKDAVPVSVEEISRLIKEQLLTFPKPKNGLQGVRGLQGLPGLDGANGWTPVLAIQEDGERRVLKIASWAGGIGEMPEQGLFIAADGLTRDIKEATDIRGPAGKNGQGGGGGGGSSSSSTVVPIFNRALSFFL